MEDQKFYSLLCDNDTQTQGNKKRNQPLISYNMGNDKISLVSFHNPQVFQPMSYNKLNYIFQKYNLFFKNIIWICYVEGVYMLEFWGGLPSMLFNLWTRVRQVYYPDWFYGRRPRLNKNETSVLSRLILWISFKINN